MKTDNYKQFVRAKISIVKFRQILRFFASDLTAVQIAHLTKLNRNTINRYLTFIRQFIADVCELEAPTSGSSEPNDSPTGSANSQDQPGHRSLDEIFVLGIFKQNGRVHTEIVTNVRKAALLQLIEEQTKKNNFIQTDDPPPYHSIVHFGYRKLFRILHSEERLEEDNQIKCIEDFWDYARVRLGKFRGMSKNTFYLHLKECEFRFNHRNENLYMLLLQMTKDNGLIWS